MKHEGEKRFQPRLTQGTGDNSFVVDHPFLTVVIALFLVWIAYLSKEEFVCRHDGFQRFDFVEEGKAVKPFWTFPAPREEWSIPVGGEIRNQTYYLACQDTRFKVVRPYFEVTSRQLMQIISDNGGSRAESQQLQIGSIDMKPSNSGGSIHHSWREKKSMQSKAQIPEWLPWDQLSEASFVGFLGYGYLFRGTQPDQYFWVGF
jgi:hypothetical protein